MLIIRKPKVEIEKETVIISYLIEEDGQERECTFVVDKKYKEYLTCERGDGIVTMLFMYALKNGHDITLDIPISSRLYYQLINYQMDALICSDKSVRPIKITAELEAGAYQKKGGRVVATGMSLGVDALCTYYTHNIENVVEDYRVNLFTFFNVGAFTYEDGKDLEGEFELTLKKVIAFSDEVGVPLLVVKSNLANVFKIDHGMTDAMRNCGIALLFQKLIDVYYYSSTYTIDKFQLDINKAAAFYDIYTVSNISTDNISFYSSNASYTRMRKIETISRFSLAQKHLSVCIRGAGCNCGKCGKCSGTLAALEACDSVENFSQVFDMSLYKKRKNVILGYAAASKNAVYYDADYDVIAPILAKKRKYSFMAHIYKIIFIAIKPIEKYMRKLPADTRKRLRAFVVRHNIKVPF